MDLSWTDEDRAFRDEVRRFLDDNLTPDLRRAGALLTSVYAGREVSAAWQAILHARGWAAPAWPIEYGGCGWSAVRRYIFARELAEAEAPPLSPMGVDMCGPVLIGHGTAEQKARLLPRILSGEDFWCQGYSEPQAGSDLAALQMRAVDDGDAFICSGHKLWITYAHHANWIFCLVRTGQTAIRQEGVTFLLIDMAAPGVEVQPIIMLTGEHIQNHVFFTDVRVPKANIVGRVGEGWAVAKYLMEFERGGAVRAPGLHARLKRLKAALLAQESGPGEEGRGLRTRLAAAIAETDALEALELRLLARRSAGDAPGPDASLIKVIGSELSQKITEIGLDVAGRYSAPFQPHAVAPGGAVPGAPPPDGPPIGPEYAWNASGKYLNDRAASIYAGTNEIQRNILAKGLLR
ncbi:MAG: acyl-CoA dehydrogenase family protein [Pseudomonadota bacterium]|uniref:acyl-CoA dehydrogenase family protein n=1 Tax=Phenylobacterium sp. TaxID=1871053 RepID=UPI0025F08C2D|nr:acyl-CoA dehydrogenase family protein [Phenylobacterium sp.]MBT9471137.1 acyl-CoA dehydrogenase family protein [Phenylobacterium sp.]